MHASNFGVSFQALVVEAELFEQLAAKAPEMGKVFADYLRLIGDRSHDVPAQEARDAGGAAGKAGENLCQAHGAYFLELAKRPAALALSHAQKERRQVLAKVDGIAEKLREFESYAICFDQDDRLDRAFSEGYLSALSTGPRQFLERLPIVKNDRVSLAEILGGNRPLLREISQSYALRERMHSSLSQQLAKKLTWEAQERFNAFRSGWDQEFNCSETHFFLRGIEIAIRQACGLPTPGLDTLDFERLFDQERLDRHLSNLETEPLDAALYKEIGEGLYSAYHEVLCETEYDAQAMALLNGYKLAVDCLKEYYPDFHEDPSFSDQLVSVVLSYLT